MRSHAHTLRVPWHAQHHLAAVQLWTARRISVMNTTVQYSGGMLGVCTSWDLVYLYLCTDMPHFCSAPDPSALRAARGRFLRSRRRYGGSCECLCMKIFCRRRPSLPQHKHPRMHSGIPATQAAPTQQADSNRHEHIFDVWTKDKKKHSFRADSLVSYYG